MGSLFLLCCVSERTGKTSPGNPNHLPPASLAVCTLRDGAETPRKEGEAVELDEENFPRSTLTDKIQDVCHPMPPELPRRVRGRHQPPDQHGALRVLLLPVHGVLL